MFDHLKGRCDFVAKCNQMRPTSETVEEDQKMAAVNFAEIGMDLFKSAGGGGRDLNGSGGREGLVHTSQFWWC